MNFMKNILNFMKQEIVFSIAVILAIISMFIVPPSTDYIGYIDFRTLALLLALMIVVLGFRNCGLFAELIMLLINKVKTKRQLVFTLVMMCFFSSMFITNDVALITFVPFTILILETLENKRRNIYIIVLETIAANLGSMLTPIGNPQNLYLYTISKMSVGEFLKTTFPYTVVVFFGLCISILFIEKKPLNASTPQIVDDGKASLNKRDLIIYSILFLVCISTVFKILDYRIMIVLVLITVGIINYKLIFKADYILLLTFIAFFIFIGNIRSIDTISLFLNKIVRGNELFISIASSQVISNVPAAMLLSGFSNNYKTLIVGLDFGGLGTLIASMASLISFKFYTKMKRNNTKKYIISFTLICLLFLAIELIAYYFIGV